MNSALMILGITCVSHHHIENLLLRSSIGWRLITYVICFAPWQIFSFNIWSIKLSWFVQFLCQESMRCCACWYSILLDIFSLLIMIIQSSINFLVISSNINILNSILGHEWSKWAQWIDTRVHYSTWLKSFWSVYPNNM